MGEYITIGEIVGIYIEEERGARTLIEEGYFKEGLGLIGDIHQKEEVGRFLSLQKRVGMR